MDKNGLKAQEMGVCFPHYNHMNNHAIPTQLMVIKREKIAVYVTDNPLLQG